MKKQFGIHLLEALIAMLLLAIVLLGIDVMLIETTKEIEKVYYLQIGMQQLLQFHEHISQHGDATDSLAAWNAQNTALLPNGEGAILNNQSTKRLFLAWGNKRNMKCNAQKGTIYCLAIDLPH